MYASYCSRWLTIKCFFKLDGYRYYLSQLSENEKGEYLPVKNTLELIPDILKRKKLEIVLDGAMGFLLVSKTPNQNLPACHGFAGVA
jgi:hypothetical protein